MSKSKWQWWVIPSVITGSLAALGALGGLAISYAKFALLPEQVEAGERKNIEQDQVIYAHERILDKITDVASQQQQMQQRMVERDDGPWLYEDEDGVFWCVTADDAWRWTQAHGCD